MWKFLKKIFGNKRRIGNKLYSEVYVCNVYVLYDCMIVKIIGELVLL